MWLEVIDMCRASFAIASIIAPEANYPYDDKAARAPFDEVLGEGHEAFLAPVDQAALHDSVMNTAIVRRHVWAKVSTGD